MSCCGQNRASVPSPVRATSPSPVSSPREKTGETPGRRIRYVGEQPLSVRGPRTGRVYYFAEAGPADVNEKDVDALLRTHLFERDGSQPE